MKGDLEFKNVTFRYEGKDELALDNISFRIPHGKTVALVGRSGSGKSTIANLVTRFYDVTQGEILLDGVNIQELSPIGFTRKLRRCLPTSALIQRYHANNIAYAAKDKYAVKKSSTPQKRHTQMEFIEHLEHGLDTVIGEKWHQLIRRSTPTFSHCSCIIA